MKTIALAALAAVLALPALAQDTVVTADAGFVDFLSRTLDILVTALIPVVVIPLVIKGFELIGVKLDRAKSDELQIAFTNAASGLIQELGDEAKALKLNVGDPRVAAYARKIQARVPGYLRWAGLDEKEIAGRAQAAIEGRILEKIPQVLNTSTSAKDIN